VASLVAVALFFVGIALAVVAYVRVAQEVPDVAQLKAKRSTFASTKVFDRDGNLIVELTDPTSISAGRRTYVPLSQISQYLIDATVATEDPNFFRYDVGFDPVAIARVFYYVLTEREFVSGGSTITQQVARNLLLSPEERNERSATRKFREIILANEVSRRYQRSEILEIYLNEINYGNLAYGIEAAAETYFNKTAKELTLGEASLLAGLPQAPAYHDPVANKDRGLARQADVLRLMAKWEFIDETQIPPAVREIQNKTFNIKPVNVSRIAPHFMQAVQSQLATEYGKQLYAEPGLRVFTTLSPTVQSIAETAIITQLAKLKDRNVSNAAVVAMDPRTGEVLAVVGSANFYSETIKGQVNVAMALRQPGSTIKPFTYLTAMEKGATPATLYWDVQTTFTNKYGQTYTPKNYDDQFHGPMLMREALARSMNVPAVATLDSVGLPDFLKMTQRVGINFPPNDQYGLAITLGGAEARLLDMTGAFAVLANAGNYISPTLISRVETTDGKVLFDRTQIKARQVIAPEHAYLMTSILSDNNARIKTFGANSVLKLSRPAAVKTGTTNDTRDNLAIGYTPDLVVGVWAGNTDNTPMKNVSGVEGAAPIWAQVVETALKGKPALDFVRPPNVVEVEICTDGGHEPSASCPPDHRRKELFKSDQRPLPPDEALEASVRAGDPNRPPPVPTSNAIVIMQPANGAVVDHNAVLSIRGVVNPPGFDSYQVEWGEGENPNDWRWISGPHRSPVINDQLSQWTPPSAPGRYSIRVTVFTTQGALTGITRFDVR
jgi:penicillin-binding protein 1C